MKHLLNHLVSNQPLSVEQTVEAFEMIMTGQASPAQVGALLGMIQQRGPHVNEITGAAQVMRSKANPVPVSANLRVIDTCGTGGDHAVTFNISTGAAIVAAGAGHSRGVAVAKHGNRSVTSNSGSSQVLAELGVKLEVPLEVLSLCLEQAGICFCFAPAHHPAMKYAVPIRQELGIRTIFNLLGPLTNPAGATRQLLGVFSPDWTQPLAQVLQQLGSERAMVVCGQFPAPHGGMGQLDEISTAGQTQISELRDGTITTRTVETRSLGLVEPDVTMLRVDNPAASARVLRSVLEGESGPARDIVCINAAAALMVADLADTLEQGLKLAYESIDSGAANKALEALVRISNS
jgi:anthranilate phosphoribosyltransferase